MKNPTEDPKTIAAAGAMLVALPVAAQGIKKLIGGSENEASSNGNGSSESASNGSGKLVDLGHLVKDKAVEKTSDVTSEAASKGAKDAASKLPGPLGKLAGGSDEDSGEVQDGEGQGEDRDSSEGTQAAPGHGSGRRMPIQQAVDVAVPLDVAYDAWSQFEDWPGFMHRLEGVQQVDDSTVQMNAKIWGIRRNFTADIVDQHPCERIEWDVAEGLAHSGVVTFHELAPRLTRIEISMDINPKGFVEKAARGMRFTKRAVRGDLHRFKAHVELENEAEDGWRGSIEEGEVKEDG